MFDLDRSGSDKLQVITSESSAAAPPAETAPVRSKNERGFLRGEALLGNGAQSGGWHRLETGQMFGSDETLIVLFDTSLSMQWEKRAELSGAQTLLRRLRPADNSACCFSIARRTFPGCTDISG
jgi:hypothetical protein